MGNLSFGISYFSQMIPPIILITSFLIKRIYLANQIAITIILSTGDIAIVVGYRQKLTATVIGETSRVP